ncbi:thymidylate kinase [Malaciobacter pacificus]|jgi:dTMP kinase|uniref:Thymidylate kinase n=1 Tax=Malaciobacter pacificus TaxID=1080223 RepID=A0A5C2HC28_9BACT|nr:dTMP kinase [Malaciobacter pacificus]QEP34354.1 dTMP kinase [Malaciobacter pacificus]GGD38180.1 thymidylate kinase [Malaciobacter pacificus]
MYVVIEGIDTAGKSTQLDLLQKKFKDAIFTKEPGGTQLGVKLRAMALGGEAKSKIAEMFLFLADRAEHIEEVIKPNINNTIISDRSVISGIAYASQLDIDKLVDLNLIATENILPSHVILLELTPEELKFRLSQKENDSIELRGIDYLINIQNRMKITLEKLNINYIAIDASLKIEEIEKKIEDFLNV